mmetsp:Transcript_2522/g.4023  ORF Transcript_2522/g.4023 Transcript_2522/m.4023 type:complete len:213 (-) Transcript_2522:2348-2986(-)
MMTTSMTSSSRNNNVVRVELNKLPPPTLDRKRLIQSLSLKAAIVATFTVSPLYLNDIFGENDIPTLVLHGHKGLHNRMQQLQRGSKDGTVISSSSKNDNDDESPLKKQKLSNGNNTTNYPTTTAGAAGPTTLSSSSIVVIKKDDSSRRSSDTIEQLLLISAIIPTLKGRTRRTLLLSRCQSERHQLQSNARIGMEIHQVSTRTTTTPRDSIG